MSKKADFILLVIIIIIAAVLWLTGQLTMSSPGAVAVVSIAGEEYGRYDLGEDRTVTLPGAGGGYNILSIAGQRASITDADCPDRLCVRQKDISGHGGSIICLPHKLAVRIERGKKGALDAVTY